MAIGFTLGPEWAQTVQDLQRLKGSVDDMRPTLVKAREAYYKEVEDVFRTEGQSAGMAWTPLSQMRINERAFGLVVTAATGSSMGGTPKAGVGADHPILQWTGDLMDAVTHPGVNVGDGIVAGSAVYKRKLKLSASGEKVVHNDGGVNARGNFVPQREFWPWYDRQFDVVQKPFEDLLDDWLASL